MSTVLWANHLAEGVVTSDESDKYALFKHLDELDALCKASGIALVSSLCDYTDLMFNMDEIELPEDMESTDELMAEQGVWVSSAEAVELLTQLLEGVKSKNDQFGLTKDEHAELVEEIEESIAYAEAGVALSAKFNFSVVM
jgi:hypothetical protein